MNAATTPRDLGRAEQEVLTQLEDMYDAFIARDRARFDTHLHASVTTWESHLPDLLPDRLALDRYRDERPASSVPVLESLRVEGAVIDIWADLALARYRLVAVPVHGGQPLAPRRVTDVLRRLDGRWQIVHHHAEAEAMTPDPEAADE